MCADTSSLFAPRWRTSERTSTSRPSRRRTGRPTRVELNRVKAVERGVDQLYNYIAELTSQGLELAEVRDRQASLNARRDLGDLRRIGVVGAELEHRLQRLRELRRLLVHEYASATAEQVHEAALIVSDNFVPFYEAYRGWIGRGFAAR